MQITFFKAFDNVNWVNVNDDTYNNTMKIINKFIEENIIEQ